MTEVDKLESKIARWLNKLNITVPFSLHDCQKEALELIMDNKDALVVAPTGIGKTLISIFASKFSSIIKNKKSLVLAPLRSLTSEHVDTYREYGILTIIDNGEYPKTLTDYYKKKYDAIISTYEKMDSIIRSYDDNYQNRKQKRDIIFNMIDNVIIDETHSIEDETRGVNLESFIMTLKFKFPHIKIIGLSATIGNFLRFSKWLSKGNYIYVPPEKRPVHLEIRMVEVYNYYQNEQYKEKLDLLIDDISKTIDEKRMIAVTSVDRTEFLVKDISGEGKHSTLELKHFMRKYKMAWHYSGSKGMSIDDRMAVEWAFQYEEITEDDEYYYESEGRTINRLAWLYDNYGLDHGINIVVCTPTLIVGRNLPVTYIDVFDCVQFSYKKGQELIKANRLQQTIGRAGRQKFAKGNPNYKGIATIYAHIEDVDEMKNRATTPFNVTSNLKEHLGEKILAWINSRIVDDSESIIKFLHTAFDPTIASNDKLIEDQIAYLLKYKFIKVNSSTNKYEVTKRGLKTIKYYIQPKTVVRWGFIISNLIKNKTETVKLNKFMTETMDVEEFTNNISVLRRDEPILAKMYNELGKPNVKLQAIKAFMFCFPPYSRKILKINETDYKIPEPESRNVRKQFGRLINACFEIFSHTQFKNVLMISKYMIAEGIFNPKLAVLMSGIKGIGPIYGHRLLKKGIETPDAFLNLYYENKKRLMNITQLSVRKLKKIIDGMK